jgi:hypothetical protein
MHRWEENFKMGHRDVCSEYMDWIQITYDEIQCLTFVMTDNDFFGSMKSENGLTS